MSEYCKNCKTMQDEIDRLRRVIKDAREMVKDWASMVSGYGNKENQFQYDLKKLDDKIANNKTERMNYE